MPKNVAASQIIEASLQMIRVFNGNLEQARHMTKEAGTKASLQKMIHFFNFTLKAYKDGN
jgi:hypothetical protein